MIKAIEGRVEPKLGNVQKRTSPKGNPTVSFGASEMNKEMSQALSSNFQAMQRINKNKDISFTGKKDHSAAKLGVGLSFITALGASIYAAKNPEHVQSFFENLKSGFAIDEAEQAISSENMHIDLDDGIYKIAGTGIDIDPDRFDIADPENGIFRNYDGSVDIDLLNNRYIDRDNGIFVDPISKISSIINGGVAQNIIVPDVTFGSGYPSHPWDSRWSENQAYWARRDAENGVVQETFWDKIKGFLGIENAESKGSTLPEAFNNSSGATKQDIFGRGIVTLPSDGGVGQVVIDSGISNIAEKYDLNNSSKARIADLVENLKLSEYIKEQGINAEVPNTGGFVSMDSFIANINAGIASSNDGGGILGILGFNNGSKLIDIDGDVLPDGIDFDGDDKIDTTLGKLVRKVFGDKLSLADSDKDGVFEGVDLDGDGKADIGFGQFIKTLFGGTVKIIGDGVDLDGDGIADVPLIDFIKNLLHRD